VTHDTLTNFSIKCEHYLLAVLDVLDQYIVRCLRIDHFLKTAIRRYELHFISGISHISLLLEHVEHLGLEEAEVQRVEEFRSVAESRFDTFFEAVYDVELHRGCKEDKLYLDVLQKVKDFVQHHLAGCLHIVVNIFEDEQD